MALLNYLANGCIYTYVGLSSIQLAACLDTRGIVIISAGSNYEINPRSEIK